MQTFKTGIALTPYCQLSDADFRETYRKHSRNLVLALPEPILEKHMLSASRGKGLA